MLWTCDVTRQYRDRKMQLVACVKLENGELGSKQVNDDDDSVEWVRRLTGGDGGCWCFCYCIIPWFLLLQSGKRGVCFVKCYIFYTYQIYTWATFRYHSTTQRKLIDDDGMVAWMDGWIFGSQSVVVVVLYLWNGFYPILLVEKDITGKKTWKMGTVFRM